MTDQSTDSFKSNYQTLKTIADTLKSNHEPNIDELVPMVDKALTAYKACVTRLDAVEAMLAERLVTPAA